MTSFWNGSAISIGPAISSYSNRNISDVLDFEKNVCLKNAPELTAPTSKNFIRLENGAPACYGTLMNRVCKSAMKQICKDQGIQCVIKGVEAFKERIKNFNERTVFTFLNFAHGIDKVSGPFKCSVVVVPDDCRNNNAPIYYNYSDEINECKDHSIVLFEKKRQIDSKDHVKLVLQKFCERR